MKSLLPIFLVVFILSSCADTKKSISSEQSENKITNGWVYKSWKNPMDDTKTYSAEIVSNEKLNFKFPYNQKATNRLHIGIRNQSGINEVILYVDEGQFIPDFTNDRGILIRFDTNEAKNFDYVMPNDGSLNGVFISDVPTFISSIKEAKKVTIQCPFYSEGNLALSFDTDSLDWKY